MKTNNVKDLKRYRRIAAAQVKRHRDLCARRLKEQKCHNKRSRLRDCEGHCDIWSDLEFWTDEVIETDELIRLLAEGEENNNHQ